MQATDFWQEIYPKGSFDAQGGHSNFYPASLKDGRQILLPIRPLADGVSALASLIVNQASFEVLDALAEDLAKDLAQTQPEVIIGLPTLGLTLAPLVARNLGHSRYVPLGTSRKFWYDDALSVEMTSITTPDQIKRLYIDPRMISLLQNRRVALVDDVISSGRSIRAGLNLLEKINVTPVVIGAAMLQSERWKDPAPAHPAGLAHWPDITCGAFKTPILKKGHDGLWYAP